MFKHADVTSYPWQFSGCIIIQPFVAFCGDTGKNFKTLYLGQAKYSVKECIETLIACYS